MPHFIVEYSGNLDSQVDFPALGRLLRDAAVDTGVFPLGGIRVRMHRCEIFEIADGRSDASFVHIVLRMGAGRDLSTKKVAAGAVFGQLETFFQQQFEHLPFALSFEVVEINSDLSFKKNTLHQYLDT